VSAISLSGVSTSFSLVSFSLFPFLRYVCLDKCIRSSLFFIFSLVAVVCNNRENTAADGQHAFASVHSFKRGGTHARSVHNDRTKGTQKKERDVNLRHTKKKKMMRNWHRREAAARIICPDVDLRRL
jgi:hypothetical protein